MDKNQRKEIVEALIDFVKEVSKNSETATAAEMEALPKVAAILVGLPSSFCQ